MVLVVGNAQGTCEVTLGGYLRGFYTIVGKKSCVIFGHLCMGKSIQSVRLLGQIVGQGSHHRLGVVVVDHVADD